MLLPSRDGAVAPTTIAAANPDSAGTRLAMPVAVAAFANETGDTSLTAWGRLAGDWVTQGLQETGLVEVVPWPYALQASERWAARSANGDSLTRVAVLREETGAGTVVTGAYYLIGDRLRIQVQITDATTGALLAAPAPIEAPRDSVEVALRALRERTMGALAVRASDRASEFPGCVGDQPARVDQEKAVGSWLRPSWASCRRNGKPSSSCSRRTIRTPCR